MIFFRTVETFGVFGLHFVLRSYSIRISRIRIKALSVDGDTKEASVNIILSETI